MKRFAVATALAVVATTTLSACGSTSPYCETVEKNQSALDSFGKTRTNAAYTSYAKKFRAVAKVAPASVRQDWTKLATVTEGVLAAQKKAEVKLEDMKDTEKLGALSADQIERLNKAYKAFNDTSKERAAVVKNVKSECDITLR